MRSNAIHLTPEDRLEILRATDTHRKWSPLITAFSDVQRGSERGSGAADLSFMQQTQARLRTVFLPKNIPQKRLPQRTKPADFGMTSYVVDEINAYVAIRDIALAEAEKEPSSVNLKRARIANDFVKNCLKPARPPYEAQHLPETDAARERGRCEE